MSASTLRRLTFVLPVLSLAVSAFIVTNQYQRKTRLTAELRSSEMEMARLVKLLPPDRRGLAPAHHDDHDHDHDHGHE